MSTNRQNTTNIQKELDQLRAAGVTLPRNPARALENARQMQSMAKNPGQLARDVSAVDVLDRWSSRQAAVDPAVANIQRNNEALMSAMGRQRQITHMRKTASGGGQDLAIAIPRFYDPMEFWDLSGLPWNMADEGHRHKLHKWLRLYYATHWLIPRLIDVFTRFPLIGINFQCKDGAITEFYEDLFLNDLKYEDFLVNLGREYWTVGEAFPLGSFNTDLGVWEREELLNPEDIIIENFPLLGTQQIKVVPPEYMKRLATTKSPPDQYKQLEINFPELIPYLKRGEPFPVSDVLLKQVAFKVTDWDDHGTPILLRGLRVLLHQEKLLASQDAIAERLYSPLILAKLGINSVGDNEGPWIPGPDQLAAFRDDMDIALSSDFRLMVYHYALEVENVFGREQVPDLWNDFDRIDRWLMAIFGLDGIMGSGSNAMPYATSALNAEFMNQILRTFQKFMKDHARQRMEVVAEAQEHFDYEKRGQTRVPIMEEVIEWDEEGTPHIVEKNKLLVPEMEMESLDLRDEATERMFRQSLRTMGVPISDEKLMVGVNFEFKDSLDEMQEEMIQKTVAQQMAKLQCYKILRAQGLTVPPDLQAEIEGGGQPGGAPGMPPGGMGGAPPMGGGGMAGGPMGGGIGGPAGGIVMPPAPPGLQKQMPFNPGLVPGGSAPAYPAQGPGRGTVPGISNERRTHMARLSMRLAWGEETENGEADKMLDEWENLSDIEIDTLVLSYAQVIADAEFRKKMRRSAWQNRELRTYEVPDGKLLKQASVGEKIVIDRVPPRFRKSYLNSE